jgi:fructosamine-3-kinase
MTSMWTSGALRAPIERSVSKYIRREWKITTARDMSELACHHCAILSDGAFGVFVKYAEDTEGVRQFECELAGLEYLAAHAGVRVPTAVSLAPAEQGTLLIMEALEAVKRMPRDWRDIGRTLAHIHRVKSDTCGFDVDGFIGPLYQDNTPESDCPTFYAERRLRPRLRAATASGNLPSPMAAQVETVMRRVPELCDAHVTPALLHGDAQQNNFVSTATGAYVIDPAVYYGDPEMDLALIDCFQPAPDDFFDGYGQEMSIDPGFWERRNLWRISLYLAAVALEGPIHLPRLSGALEAYL